MFCWFFSGIKSSWGFETFDSRGLCSTSQHPVRMFAVVATTFSPGLRSYATGAARRSSGLHPHRMYLSSAARTKGRATTTALGPCSLALCAAGDEPQASGDNGKVAPSRPVPTRRDPTRYICKMSTDLDFGYVFSRSGAEVPKLF